MDMSPSCIPVQAVSSYLHLDSAQVKDFSITASSLVVGY